jgi:hypothetical protein
MENSMNLWQIIADFFKSDPLYVVLSILTIIGFFLTLNVYVKIKSINYSIKKLEYYKSQYEIFRKMIKGENTPTDLYKRVKRNNNLLYHNLGFWKSVHIKNMFKSVDISDKNYDGLKAFLNEIIITLEKDVA